MAENDIEDAAVEGIKVETKKSKVSYVEELLNCPICRIQNLDASSMTTHLFKKHGKQILSTSEYQTSLDGLFVF